MRNWSANRHAAVVVCAVFLIGGLGSAGRTREVPVKYEQDAQSQDQPTRMTIDKFNEVFNRHDAEGLAALLTEDTVFEDKGIRLLVDRPSLPYVKGSVIDFIEGLQGAGFKVDNPNVVAACGCGSSFRVAEEEEVSAV